MKKFFFPTIFLFIAHLPAAGQLPVDSLLKVFEKQTNDSLRWISLFNISQYYASENFDSALVWAEKAHAFIAPKRPDITPRSLNNIGLQYMNKGNMDRAMEYYLLAADAAQKYNCIVCLGTTTGNLGLVAWNKKEYDKAEYYFREAIDILRSVGDLTGQARYFNNLGLVQTDTKKIDQAEQSYKEALKLLERADTLAFQPTIYINLANIAYARNDFEGALKNYQSVAESARKSNDGSSLFLGVNNAGWAYLAMNRFDDAVRQFKESLQIAKELKNDKFYEYALGALADGYKGKGDFQQAFNYLEQYTKFHDSLLIKQNNKAVMELETQYQTRQKEAAIIALKSENRIRNILNYTALAGIAALGFALFSLNKANRRRRQLQQAEIDRLESERKVVALHAHVEGQQRERLRIAEDLHDDFGSGLSKISLLSEIVKKKVPDTMELDKISIASKELLLKMSEVVWALNHHNDTLAGLTAYVRRYAAQFFEDADIRCIFHLPDQLPDVELSGETRRNLFLVIKESLHNILKHAEAVKVDISFYLEDYDELCIKIQDDGKGFDAASMGFSGNGLGNMQKRIQAEGGIFRIESTPGKGTLTTITLPLEGSATQAIAA